MRKRISNILFGLSSFLKVLGKLVRSKEKTIVCDVLSLPGWFILDNCIIYQTALLDDSLLSNGFQWYAYAMPDKWCEQMDSFK